MCSGFAAQPAHQGGAVGFPGGLALVKAAQRGFTLGEVPPEKIHKDAACFSTQVQQPGQQIADFGRVCPCTDSGQVGAAVRQEWDNGHQ